MNGRCETDPLDRAVDVCDSCYGEFCKVCLVLPKGRRHPICTHCTLVLSGVRGHATVQPRGEKRTVKQRRAELAAAAAEPSDDKVFRFFDADAEPDDAEAGASGRRGGRRAPRRDRRVKGGTTGPGHGSPNTAPLPMPAEVAAAAAELRAAANGGAGAPAAVAGGPRIADGAPTGDSVSQADGVAVADPTELVTVTRAVARLEELRRQGASPVASPVPEVPSASPAPEVPSAAGPAAPTATDDAEPLPGADEPAAANGPARRPGPPPKPRSAAAPAARPDRRRPDGADGDGRPPTAPMVGEVRTIGGRRSSDQAPPPQPARLRPAAAATTAAAAATDDELVSVSEALSGIEQFDAAQPAPAPATPDKSRKADTDSRGNWIPPILRGMAPDARQAKTNLPKRKRGS